MKKSCDGCRALRDGFNGGFYCDLGFKLEGINISYITVSAKPLEECPKPRTWNQYCQTERKTE